MKNIITILLAVLALAACETPTEVVTQSPPADDDQSPTLLDDPRLTLVDAASTKWLRLPASYRGIADGDPVAAYCTEPGWSYIFFDDAAVIGYEPLPDNATVMHDAVRITVELHNRDNPGAEWDYINVAPIGPSPPDVSNDPVLDVWQYALCLDDGSIVGGPYTAEYDYEWEAWKTSGAALELEMYNRDNDPDAHIVWGPDA